MKRYFVLVSVLFSFALIPINSYPEESIRVTSEGVAAVQEGSIDITRNAALEDAQLKAVEHSIGIFIDFRTRLKNSRIISEAVLSQAKRYVSSYTLLDERTDSGLLRVRINAVIDRSKLEIDLSALGIRAMSDSDNEASGTRQIIITVMGLTKTQASKIKEVLLTQVRSIRSVRDSELSGNSAKFHADIQTSTQALSHELALKDFGKFSVEVVGSTANSLELKVVPKQ